MKWRIAMVALLAVGLGVMAHGTAAFQQVPLTTDLTGTLGGTAYKIRMPENWNGTLLVFAHGIQITAPAPVVAPPPVEAQLLQAGYALAGSGFGNSYKDGVLRTHQLTGFFIESVANPQRVIVWGNSLGGDVTQMLLEKYPGIYDGAIANCSTSAGATENMDSALAFSLAYDAAVGWREDLWGPIGDLRDDVAIPDVLPIVPWPASQDDPRWEFIRLVMHVPSKAFWTVDPMTKFSFYQLQMWKATVLRSAAELENGGPVAENAGIRYTVEDDGYARLADLGLSRADVDGMLDYMNGHATIRADKAARMHLAQWGAPSGRLRRPVLTVHGQDDGMAYVTNESYYKALVESAGTEDLLVQSYVAGPVIGHCTFTPDQYMTALAAMNSWLNTGVPPDASFFPAAKGFNTGFVPGPWIF
jgi:pimeloyl-ACP methyl ester carboxylesterase